MAAAPIPVAKGQGVLFTCAVAGRLHPSVGEHPGPPGGGDGLGAVLVKDVAVCSQAQADTLLDKWEAV